MKFIELIKLKNKNFKVYKINQFEVYKFKKLHLDILKTTLNELDCPYNYKRFKKDIKSKNHIVFLMYYKNKPISFSYVSFPQFNDPNIDYTKRYNLKEKELPFVCEMSGCSVLSKYRGLGIQDYFLKLRERYAKEKGYKYFYIAVSPKNKYSLKNIKKNKYTIKLHKFKNKKGFDRVFLMKKSS